MKEIKEIEVIPVSNVVKKLKYDPLKELIEIAKNPETHLAQAVKIHLELMQYLYPKMHRSDDKEVLERLKLYIAKKEADMFAKMSIEELRSLAEKD